MKLREIIASLKRRHGGQQLPPARGPFELVMWEHSGYLLTDEKRAVVFETLRSQVGLTPHAIAAADDKTLLPIARMGGMQPEARVDKWREIARIALDQFDGDLDRILQEPFAKAKKALKLFPSIGDPGAEKILLFCGVGAGLPLESNGVRILIRVGYAKPHKNYSTEYRSLQEAIAGELPPEQESLVQAHLLLREHGKTLCRTNAPQCYECPITQLCEFGKKSI